MIATIRCETTSKISYMMSSLARFQACGVSEKAEKSLEWHILPNQPVKSQPWHWARTKHTAPTTGGGQHTGKLHIEESLIPNDSLKRKRSL